MKSLREQIQRCWSVPMINGSNTTVSVRFRLDHTGALVGEPEIVADGEVTNTKRVFSEAAKRAIKKCAPYSLPPEKYEAWSNLIVHFDPSADYRRNGSD
ncbi:TonB C-terminal domain-containing protein [Allomesorhizobium camelthorni]|uniref:Cell envelope integrity protein TolA n=1 Tax=Allomesorhizobium camelthorni TaxID=475069 RepID=A0A6G4WGY7_9HYPH|nr:TonB C-terminal domain-containing protein [Mesorhizobium camelthorni]NGO53486.1 cell envelope integrity protein TolA [Mesorhizobium camelthorni]